VALVQKRGDRGGGVPQKRGRRDPERSPVETELGRDGRNACRSKSDTQKKRDTGEGGEGNELVPKRNVKIRQKHRPRMKNSRGYEALRGGDKVTAESRGQRGQGYLIESTGGVKDVEGKLRLLPRKWDN